MTTLDSFDTGFAMLGECAEVAIEAMPANESKAYLRNAAKARLVEFQVLLCLSAGRQYDYHPKLGPLIRAIDDFIQSVDTRIQRPIDERSLPEDALEAALIQREDALTHLDQARIAACSLLVHLSLGMKT